MDEGAAARQAAPGGGSTAGKACRQPGAGFSGPDAARTFSAGAPQAASRAPSPSTHRDREREARSLALAGVRLVPLLSRVARVCVDGGSPWFGYADLGDFAREALGRSGRWLRDLAELGAGLEQLPGLEAALLGADGGAPLGRVAGRCVARTASAATLGEWVALARRVPVRELLEAARAARRAGSDRPLGAGAEAPQEKRGAKSGATEALGTPGTLSTPSAPSTPGVPGALGGDFVPTGAVEDDDSETILSEVRLDLPVPVDVAVDEVRDLHRAVGGREASLASLVEALVGEALAGPHPPDVELVPVSSGESQAAREKLLAQVNAGWKELDAARELVAHPQATALEREVEQVLEQVVAIEAAVTWNAPSAVVAGWQLWDLVQIEDRLEHLLGRALHAMSRHGDWSQLGFSGVGHYAEERLGLGRRTAESRAAIVGALANRPKIRAAYASGGIGLEAAWLLVRVLGRGPVDPEIEAAWVKCARRVSVKRLRDEVRRARWESCGAQAPVPPGAPAGTPAASETAPGSEPPDLATLPTSAFEPRVLPRTLRPVVPLPATDAEWQASLRRWPGRTRERVWRLGNHALENPGADVLRRFRLPQDLAGPFLSAIECERRRLEHQAQLQVDSGSRPSPKAQASVRAAHEFADRLRRVPAWVGLLSLLEDFAHTWDDPRRLPKRRWKRIYERENYRCAAPGCTRSATIEDHHIDYRSDLGSDEPWNQIALCKFHHHQGEHGRFAKVRGQAPLGLTWRLGIPLLASWWRNETRIDPQDGNAIDARTMKRAPGV